MRAAGRDHDSDPGRLLDANCRDRICDSIETWVQGPLFSAAVAEKCARLVESDLMSAANALLVDKGDRQCLAAVLEFIECAWEVHYAVKCDLTLSGYRVEELRGAWTRMLEAYATLGAVGQKFQAGRKPGTASPIRAAITRLLKADPTLKNAQIWAALAARPPRGWNFRDNRLGKYIEGPKSGHNMDYHRFQNICSEERKKFTG